MKQGRNIGFWQIFIVCLISYTAISFVDSATSYATTGYFAIELGIRNIVYSTIGLSVGIYLREPLEALLNKFKGGRLGYVPVFMIGSFIAAASLLAGYFWK